MQECSDSIIVSVQCCTYNQAKYIRQCLDGFLAQKTSFRFEVIVHDDASTDDTAKIVLEYAHRYPSIIIPILGTENLYSKHDGSLARVMNQASRGKYIAFCEGDDYWIDSNKLQKQFDFLEAHKDFSLCFHSAMVENSDGCPQYINCENIEEREYFSKDIFPKWIIPTASVMCRRDVVLRPIKHVDMLLYGDIALFLSAAEIGRIWGMSRQMSVYRIHQEGVTQIEIAPDYRKWIRHEKCLKINFPSIDRTLINKNISSYYYSLAKNDCSVLNRCIDYLGSLYHSPKFFLNKVYTALRRRL